MRSAFQLAHAQMPLPENDQTTAFKAERDVAFKKVNDLAASCLAVRAP
jgi:hypothetical protein